MIFFDRSILSIDTYWLSKFRFFWKIDKVIIADFWFLGDFIKFFNPVYEKNKI